MSDTTTATPDATYVTEYDAIVRTVQHYIDGAKSGRSADMKPAFHPDATIFGYHGPHLVAGPIQLLFDFVDQSEPAAGLEARITSVEIVGSVATVRLDSDNWSGHRFTDMFALLNLDGSWLIMSKVFHLHA
jgi:hypothetical protein